MPVSSRLASPDGGKLIGILKIQDSTPSSSSGFQNGSPCWVISNVSEGGMRYLPKQGPGSPASTSASEDFGK